ncbi:glycoside hydrolase family 3 N-terminal domain-containing protein [Leifsonia xyli]|uniref:glycoside hydrolase family 3 N-terminal domain-containing protein n=1 Tax=Leifsonia xyli TaxID=1575 RepID=UPI0002F4C066|nr:glycoside hydrolase family 3 N-terminal domain-containing protein [Leifsonia xyli]
MRAVSPHGTGALLVEEAPHGHQALGAPLLPVNLASAAAWRPDLVRAAASTVSGLLRADGVHLALVSTLDLLRDPRWGRSEECFGESPALAAALTEAVVLGMQGNARTRLADGSGVGVVLKHFAAQGDGMGGRNGQSAPIGRRELRELHLPAARAGVEAGALGLMAAYKDIDGVPCCADAGLLTGTLRGEWGFDGVVMADGKAVDRLIAQLGSPAAAAAAALTAGVDLSFGGTKNGMLYGEAVVVLNPDASEGLLYLRKLNMQLASKMRFISAQLIALLTDDLHLRSASHANAMAARLRGALEAGIADGSVQGIGFSQKTQANGVFATLPDGVADRLRERFRFYDWDAARNEVRWMCSFDTTEQDIDDFVAALVRELGR